MDDRILLVPVVTAPDPDVFESWPAVSALLLRLRAFLPVDILRYPWIKGETAFGEGSEIILNAFKRTIAPQHHIVDLSCGEPLLLALTFCPARSLTVAGFWPSPATLAAQGLTALAASVSAVYSVSANPAQVLATTMQGADQATIETAVKRTEETLDRHLLGQLLETGKKVTLAGSTRVDLPALYLSVPTAMPGAEGMFEVFQGYVPNARADVLLEWGPRVHEEAGGHELADKVIPFIEEVIAAREAAAQ